MRARARARPPAAPIQDTRERPCLSIMIASDATFVRLHARGSYLFSATMTSKVCPNEHETQCHVASRHTSTRLVYRAKNRNGCNGFLPHEGDHGTMQALSLLADPGTPGILRPRYRTVPGMRKCGTTRHILFFILKHGYEML